MAGSFIQLNAQGADQLKVIALAMAKLPASEIADISEYVNGEMGGELQPLITERMHGELDSVVYSGKSKINITASKLSLTLPVPSKRLSGGFKVASGNYPKDTPGYIAVEFGGDPENVSEVVRRSKRGLIAYERHTERQLPRRYAKGRVFYPSVKAIMPRVLAMISQTTIRAYLSCFDEGS